MAHSTRTPEECTALANRQKAGEALGFSDEFVRQWAGKGGAAPAAKAEAAPAAKAEAAPAAKAEPEKAEPAAGAKADKA